MRVVLLNPSDINSRNTRMMRDFVGSVPPYGLLMIASVLRKSGHEVCLIDQYIECKEENELLNDILKFNPDVVGISVLAPAFISVKQLCKALRNTSPGVKIVLGNSFSSIFYGKILEDDIADVIVHGEGEYTFDQYLKIMGNGGDLRNVKGISFKEGNSVVKNQSAEVINNLDSLPYPSWDLIDFDKYSRIPMLSLYGQVLMIQGSRGCNYNCFYCSQDATFKNVRRRQLTSIVDEIEYLYEKYNVPNFIFLDAYFPFSVKSGLEFCDEIIKRNLQKKIRWITETKVDLVNYELLKRMKEAGVYLIMYGFETGSERILRMINKHTTLDMGRKVMEDTRKAGIRTLGLFMLGFPGETEEECNKTIRYSKELGCDLVKYNPLTPYPGSGLYDNYVEDKLTAYNRPELFTSWYMISNKDQNSFNFSNVDTAKLLDIQRWALLSYYVRPAAIYNIITKRIVKFEAILKGLIFLSLTFISMFKNKARGGCL